MVIKMTNRNKIQKEEKKKQEISRLQQKRIKRNKKVKLILKILLLVVVLAGSFIFAFTSPIFNIKEVQALENNQVTSETIVSLSELKPDENIFKFSKNQVTNKIKENPYIEEVIISRKLPSIVQIKVKERVATYSVDYMGKYAYINNQGYILEISEETKGLPILYGISTEEENIILNSRLNNEDLKKLEDTIEIMKVAKENNLDNKVTSIDIVNENEYSIYLAEEKKKVHLGDNTNLSNKMLYVISILEETKGQEGDIFVNGDLNNKFRTYFREKVEV